jgi:Ca2+/Na+ antiporter
MKTFYDGKSKIPWPETRKKQILYILMVPLTHL